MISFKYKAIIIGVSLIIATSTVAACNNRTEPSEVNGDADGSDSTNNPPVETKKPNTDYKPSFTGQTRVPGVKTKTDYSVTVINNSLKQPWGICQLPDGRLLISENKGTMRIVSMDGQQDKEVTGFPPVVSSGQGGLLDVNIDPDFTSNKIIYWGFSEQTPDGTLLAIAKGKLSADESTVENPEVIYRATPAYTGSLQYGTRIVFDKQGNLFISIGERSAKEIRVQAQDLNSSLGKIIHITKDGQPVPNGPFATTPNAKPEIYAYGIRNPDGLAWNPQTGELWEAEFGPRGGDEINIIRAGKNYGWPVITYGIEYSGEKVGDGIQQEAGMEQPVYYWDPSVSPSGISFYNSDVISEWKGNLFVACLSGLHIARLVIENDKVIGEERLLDDLGERFRTVIEGRDGELYTITDSGKLYRIAKN